MQSILFIVGLLAAGAAPNVEFPSEGRLLKGWIFRPAATSGTPAPAVIWNHGSNADVEPELALAKTYTDRGFVFFLPVRRYHRPSGTGKTIMQLIDAAWFWNKQQKWVELNEEENRDVYAALEWLKSQPDVDPRRIIVSGVSFGGVQTLLSAERGGEFRAAVAFAPAAMAWGGSNSKINARMKQAVEHRKLPLFIIQAHNDFNLGPTDTLGPLLDEVKLPHRVKQYPDYGTRAPGMTDMQWHALGHHGFAVEGGDLWGPDVFSFIQSVFDG